jgi:hypothetical protein
MTFTHPPKWATDRYTPKPELADWTALALVETYGNDLTEQDIHDILKQHENYHTYKEDGTVCDIVTEYMKAASDGQ